VNRPAAITRKTAVALLALLAVAGGCRGKRDASQPGPLRSVGAAPAGTQGERPIRAALRSWGESRQRAAVEILARAAQRDDWRAALCLMPMTEAQFVRLPQDQRTSLRQRMLQDLEVVRALARRLRTVASEAEAAGDREAADRWRLALRRLGEANRGAHVPALVDLVGQAIVRLSENDSRPAAPPAHNSGVTSEP